MAERFEIEFSKEVLDFLDQVEEKARDKILFNIDKAIQMMNEYFNSKK